MGEDVNERVREEWVGDTTPRERVVSVMRRTYEPEPVTTIAERALVSENFARKHLDCLAEDEFVEVEDDGEPRYSRAPESVVRERIEQMLDEVDVETLEERVEELRADVREGDENEGETACRNLRFAEAALEFVEDGAFIHR